MTNVLVVEDSASMRNLLVTTVEGLGGIRVVAAANGFDALKLLPRGDFDLIITDINMPDINGLELIRFIKQHPRYVNTPLVIVTSEGSEQDRDRGLALGVDDYLVKPFEPAELQRRVRGLLEPGGAM